MKSPTLPVDHLFRPPAARLLPLEHLNAPPDSSLRISGPRHLVFPALIEKTHLGPIPRISVTSLTSPPTHRRQLCLQRALSVGSCPHDCPETPHPPHRTLPRGGKLRSPSQAIGHIKSRRLILGWVQIGSTKHVLGAQMGHSPLDLIFPLYNWHI